MSKRKLRIPRYLRWILWATGLLFAIAAALVICLIEYVYHSGLSRFPEMPEPPRLVLPPLVEQLIWSEFECGPMEIDRAGAYETAAKVFLYVTSTDKISNCSIVKGDRLAAKCARSFITEEKKGKFAQLALSIWLRKNWSIPELISCAAGTTIHEYAWYYHQSTLENLTASKQITVTMLTQNPYFWRRGPTVFVTRRNFLIGRLADNGWLTKDYRNQLISAPLCLPWSSRIH